MQEQQTEANCQGALGWIRCLERGDFPAIFQLHAEDVIVNLLGTTAVSGQVCGRDQYFEYTNAQVMTSLDPNKEPYLKKWRLACADYNAAAIFFNGSFPALDGSPEGRYNQNYLAVVQACAGQIRKLTEMADTAMIETAIYRRKLEAPRISSASPYDLDLVKPRAASSTSRAQNIILAEDWLDAIRIQDDQVYREKLAKDLVVNIVGSTPYSGRWQGRDAFLDLPFDFHSSELFKPDSRDIGRRNRLMCVDEHAFCVLMAGNAITATGQTYRQHYSVVAELADGLISEMHIHLDTAQAEEKLFANPFRDPPLPSPHAPFSLY